jgi:uncharacterized membrane protein
MNKQEFMRKLEDALARLKPEERRDILSDFEEHFAGGIASGKTEQEVAQELGDPTALAAQYTEGLPEVKPPIRASGVAAGVLASIALLLFDAMIALPIAAVFISIWASLWAVAVSIFGAGLVFIVAPLTHWISPINALSGAGSVFIGISLLALAVLAGIGMYYVTVWFFKGIAGYVKAHIRIIKGGTLG